MSCFLNPLEFVNQLLLSLILELLGLVGEAVRALALVFAPLKGLSDLVLVLLGGLVKHHARARRGNLDPADSAVVLIGVGLPGPVWSWPIGVLIVVLHYPIHL